MEDRAGALATSSMKRRPAVRRAVSAGWELYAGLILGATFTSAQALVKQSMDRNLTVAGDVY
jgi:hypothetical protein